MLILSTERNPVVTARARKLGVEVLQGVEDKAGALQKWLAENGIDPAKTAYVGNDINDVPCLELVGWPVVVPEAHIEARMRARVILTRPGGRGAVRELCERVIASRRET
jgi:N-acylneuraminate cytidylyltransferase